MIAPTTRQQTDLKTWYQEHFRALPWRKTKDPYKIWISETMLQQTTTQAVIPYFEKFLSSFPTVHALASAPLTSVFEMWSGLGYYSRARNLHKAAVLLDQMDKFPKRYEELITLPGLGPYTARAVASLAFEQEVGVLDGNVIRVLSRFHGLKWEWWKTKPKVQLQSIADLWVKGFTPSVMNQALMELGATICTPKSPSCLLCPLSLDCTAKKRGLVTSLPLSKPRKIKETYVWSPLVLKKAGALFLDENHSLPFLKSRAMPPGLLTKTKTKPKKYDFKHTITHHDIYVIIDTQPSQRKALKGKWVQIHELSQINPSSILKKLLATDQRRAHDLHSS